MQIRTKKIRGTQKKTNMNLYLSLLPFNRSQKSRICRIDDYTYYNPSWHIYHRCGHLYIASQLPLPKTYVPWISLKKK